MAIVITLVWGRGRTGVIASILKAVMGLRSNADEEEAGLDLGHHGESAYSGTEQSGSAAALHV